MSDSRVEYERRLGVWAARIERFDRTHLVISNLRLLLASLFVAVAWVALARSALSPARRSASAAAICADRMPFASHAPRPYNRSPSRRLGKKGGTQSKCVENTTDGGPAVAMTLNLFASTGCLVTV